MKLMNPRLRYLGFVAILFALSIIPFFIGSSSTERQSSTLNSHQPRSLPENSSPETISPDDTQKSQQDDSEKLIITPGPPSGLILGSIKSGLSNLFTTMKQAKMNVKNENIANEGEVVISWQLIENLKKKNTIFIKEVEEQKGNEPNNELDLQDISKVVHLVRHPVSMVAAILQDCFCYSEKTSTEKHMKEETYALDVLQKVDKDFPIHKSRAEQALYHWVTWNEFILFFFPNAWIVKAEDVDLKSLLQFFDLPYAKMQAWDYPRSFIPKTQATNMTWSQMESQIDNPALLKRALALVKKFNYHVNPPIKVSAIQYKCEDQTHYLVHFLSIMPHTHDRPFRFQYNTKLDHYEILKSKIIPDYSLLYVMSYKSKNWKDYIQIGQLNPGLIVQIHKDEYCEYDPREIPNIALAYHGYYDYKMIDDKKVFWFPLGVRKIFPRILPHEIQPVAERKYVFNLIIALNTSPTRAELAKLARDLPYKAFIHTVDEWSDKFSGYIGPHEYKEKLLQSVFTLNPKGHNPECYRIYEAAEAGSIPILEEYPPELEAELESQNKKFCRGSLEPFKRTNAPFIYISDWKELPNLLENLLKNPQEIARMQQELVDWNYRFKMDTITNMERNMASLWQIE